MKIECFINRNLWTLRNLLILLSVKDIIFFFGDIRYLNRHLYMKNNEAEN